MNANSTLVTISIVIQTPDRRAVADMIAPAMAACVAAGGRSVNVSVQSYDEAEMEEVDD